MKTNAKDRSTSAGNLLWRWEAHAAGEGAFDKSFPAKRYDHHDHQLWEAWDRVRDYIGQIAAPDAFDSRTFTDRIREIAGPHPSENALSPASLKMTKYTVSGYEAPDIPKATLDAMNAWLSERQRLLAEFGKLFEDDHPWHPYQRCIRAAESSLRKLENALWEATNRKAHAR
jgi:hypothetical protein